MSLTSDGSGFNVKPAETLPPSKNVKLMTSCRVILPHTAGCLHSKRGGAQLSGTLHSINLVEILTAPHVEHVVNALRKGSGEQSGRGPLRSQLE